MLAGYSAMPTPRGWARHEACTLRECYDLQTRLQQQEMIDWQRESTRDVRKLEARFAATHDRLVARMQSSATTQYERDFIREYLKLQADKLEKHERAFACGTAYLRVLEHDGAPGRRDDEESVNLDRIG